MAAGDRYFTCLRKPDNWEQVFGLLAVKDAEGNHFLNVYYNERDARNCANYEAAFECLQDADLLDILELVVVEDECGNPALNLLANICDVCGEEEPIM